MAKPSPRPDMQISGSARFLQLFEFEIELVASTTTKTNHWQCMELRKIFVVCHQLMYHRSPVSVSNICAWFNIQSITETLVSTFHPSRRMCLTERRRPGRSFHQYPPAMEVGHLQRLPSNTHPSWHHSTLPQFSSTFSLKTGVWGLHLFFLHASLSWPFLRQVVT